MLFGLIPAPIGLLQGSLKEVEALQEVKAELEGKTSLLYTRLMEDLTEQVLIAQRGGGGQGGAGGILDPNPYQSYNWIRIRYKKI